MALVMRSSLIWLYCTIFASLISASSLNTILGLQALDVSPSVKRAVQPRYIPRGLSIRDGNVVYEGSVSLDKSWESEILFKTGLHVHALRIYDSTTNIC